MDIQVPSNIYVGRNTVRVHLADFLQIAADRNIFSSDEQILAVFDCIILDDAGARLGGFTLHDYAILTNQNLITWARGRSKDTIDKCIWSNITIERFGRRNPLEGVIKFAYRVPVTGSKRRISLRAKDDSANSPKVVAKDENEPIGNTINIFLDLIPLEDVQICQKMMNYFIASKPEQVATEFFTLFKAELDESTARLVTVPATMRPLYVRQPNGVYIEKGELEEERLLRSMETRQTPPPSPYQGVTTLKRGYASPYQLRNNNQNDSSGFKSSNTGSYTGRSKLDAYEQGNYSKPTEQKNKPIPEPAKLVYKPVPAEPVYKPKPEPTYKPRPVDKPAVQSPYQNQSNLIPPDSEQPTAPGEGANVATPSSATIRDVPSMYSISRLAHGLFEGRQSFGKSVADVSETAAILTSIPGLLSNDESTKHSALMKLRVIFEGGYLDKNPLLGKALMPLMQPLLSRYIPMGMMGGKASAEPPQKRNRLTIRGTGEGERSDSEARPNVPFKNRQTDYISISNYVEPNNSLIDELPSMGEIVGTDALENIPAVPIEMPVSEQPKRVKLVKEVPVSTEPEVVPERTIVEIQIPELELPPELANPAQPKRIKLGKK
ncbi:hypothetical protein [Candidatus Chlorohelix sp.]|uniref:hypothetical protein n=1 Tax=Candidatus Chlorohelix sp. TaxID=3139201 RepID=UPI0030214CB2